MAPARRHLTAAAAILSSAMAPVRSKGRSGCGLLRVEARMAMRMRSNTAPTGPMPSRTVTAACSLIICRPYHVCTNGLTKIVKKSVKIYSRSNKVPDNAFGRPSGGNGGGARWKKSEKGPLFFLAGLPLFLGGRRAGPSARLPRGGCCAGAKKSLGEFKSQSSGLRRSLRRGRRLRHSPHAAAPSPMSRSM